MTASDNQHPPEMVLDLLLLGDLGPAERAEVERHLAACSRCRNSFAENEANARHFETHVYPRGFAFRADGEHLVEAGGRKQNRPHFLALAAFLACAVGVFALLPRRVALPPAPADEGLIQKGGPSLTVFVKHGDTVTPLVSGKRIDAGDAFRFSVETGSFPYLMVASVDGAGAATVYLPYGGKQSLKVGKNRHFEDSGSIILDATTGPERLFALFSDGPMLGTEVLATLQELGRRGPGAIRATSSVGLSGCRQISISFEK